LILVAGRKRKPQPAVDPRVLINMYRRDAKTRRDRAAKTSGTVAAELIRTAEMMEAKATKLEGESHG